MKIVIWGVCIFINACIRTIAQANGVFLGAIPTALLYLVTILLARTLCGIWDKHKRDTETQSKTQCQTSPQPAPIKPVASQPIPAVNPINVPAQPVVKTGGNAGPRKMICPHCGARQPEGTQNCKYCGTAMQ